MHIYRNISKYAATAAVSTLKVVISWTSFLGKKFKYTYAHNFYKNVKLVIKKKKKKVSKNLKGYGLWFNQTQKKAYLEMNIIFYIYIKYLFLISIYR